METKIIFNGKTYTKLEEMPSEVRQAYEQALAQFADANKNGIPDILEGVGAGNVISIQRSSISFNGREYKSEGEMPPVVRRLFEMAMGQADANRNNIPDALETALGIKPATAAAQPPPAAGDRVQPSELGALERTAKALETLLWTLLVAVSFATVAGAIFLMLRMDAGSRSQGGRFYVALVALAILGGIDSAIGKLVVRRAPLSWGTTEIERRYALVSLLFLLLAAVILFAAAFYLP